MSQEIQDLLRIVAALKERDDLLQLQITELLKAIQAMSASIRDLASR